MTVRSAALYACTGWSRVTRTLICMQIGADCNFVRSIGHYKETHNVHYGDIYVYI